MTFAALFTTVCGRPFSLSYPDSTFPSANIGAGILNVLLFLGCNSLLDNSSERTLAPISYDIKNVYSKLLTMSCKS